MGTISHCYLSAIDCHKSAIIFSQLKGKGGKFTLSRVGRSILRQNKSWNLVKNFNSQLNEMRHVKTIKEMENGSSGCTRGVVTCRRKCTHKFLVGVDKKCSIDKSFGAVFS